jgi:hypothetical protein
LAGHPVLQDRGHAAGPYRLAHRRGDHHRVWDDTTAGLDLFDGLRRIGIDEISYKRNYKYLTVVDDHDTGRLVWVAAGRDQATLRGFFDALGPERWGKGRDLGPSAFGVVGLGGGPGSGPTLRPCPGLEQETTSWARKHTAEPLDTKRLR